MSHSQIEELFFRSPNGLSDNRARKRLPQLCRLRYLIGDYCAPDYPGNKGFWFYRLGQYGARRLADKYELALDGFDFWGKQARKSPAEFKKRTDPYIRHSLELTSIRLAFEQDATAHGVTIEAWQDETDIRRRHRSTPKKKAGSGDGRYLSGTHRQPSPRPLFHRS